MISERRCIYPGTLFHRSKADMVGQKADGDWIGRRSAEEVKKIKMIGFFKKKSVDPDQDLV
jgi:hypothetical protein